MRVARMEGAPDGRGSKRKRARDRPRALLSPDKFVMVQVIVFAACVLRKVIPLRCNMLYALLPSASAAAFSAARASAAATFSASMRARSAPLRLALGIVEAAGAHARVLGDAGRLAATIAQVIELGAAHLAAAHDLDRLDQRRIDREDALDALAIGNLADGEVLVEAGARTRDAHALIGLHAGRVPSVTRTWTRTVSPGWNSGSLRLSSIFAACSASS